MLVIVNAGRSIMGQMFLYDFSPPHPSARILYIYQREGGNELEGMTIERKWAMPNRWTFTIKPIADLLSEEVRFREVWIDPFAGYNSPACEQNDLDPKSPAESHQDALEYLKSKPDAYADGVLYDPPYSITQARKYGSKKYSSMKYWADCKKEIARIVKPRGKVICFGWNTMGIGKTRGFQMNRVLIVPHGGSKNDTLVTVENRI